MTTNNKMNRLISKLLILQTKIKAVNFYKQILMVYFNTILTTNGNLIEF